jgi:cytochrome b
MKTIQQRVWDWPLRLFHWLLVVAVVGSYITGELGGSLTDWHNRLGVLTLGLLVFRVLWGFFGSYYSRFVNFFPTPERLITYFRGDWHGVGHNPLGALSIFALLLVLSALVLTGLFANDDIGFNGPLFHLIDKGLSDRISGWHGWLVYSLLGLVSLHVSAIFYYLLIKKNNLIQPMLTGNKLLRPDQIVGSEGSYSLRRFILAVFMALVVVWIVWSGLLIDYLA